MRLTQYACALTASLPLAPRSTVPQLNIFGDIFDDGLKAIEPYERPLLPSLVKSRAYSYTLQEKMFSFSGEDFKVKDLEGNDVLYIDGGNINLGGWVLDKLAFKDDLRAKNSARGAASDRHVDMLRHLQRRWKRAAVQGRA